MRKKIQQFPPVCATKARRFGYLYGRHDPVEVAANLWAERVMARPIKIH